MEENKVDNSIAISDLIKYINDLKQEQSSLQKQYKELSEEFVPVEYKKRRLLDLIIPYRYKKFKKAYIDSQRKERKLKNIDEHILLLQMEIEENENFLYKLQYEMSHSISSPENITEKAIDNNNIEPSIDE